MRFLVLFALVVCFTSTESFLLKKRLKKQMKKGGAQFGGLVIAPLPPLQASHVHFAAPEPHTHVVAPAPHTHIAPAAELHDLHLHHSFPDPGHFSAFHVDLPHPPPPAPVSAPVAAPAIHAYIQRNKQGKYFIYCPYEVYGMQPMEPVKGNIQPRW